MAFLGYSPVRFEYTTAWTIFGCWDIYRKGFHSFKKNENLYFSKVPKLLCLYFGDQISHRGGLVSKTNDRLFCLSS